MLVIHKFGPFEVNTEFTINCDKVVHFTNRNNQLYVWAQINKALPNRLRNFVIIGTGWEYEREFVHLTTTVEEPYVWHLLEERRSEDIANRMFPIAF